MPLGIDRSSYLSSKIQQYEVESRRKYEHIIALQTENAMLHIKMSLQQKNLNKYIESLADSYTENDVRKLVCGQVKSSLNTFKQEIHDIRAVLKSMKKYIYDFKSSLVQQSEEAMAAVVEHYQSFHKNPDPVLQEQILSLRKELEEMTEKCEKEKTWRKKFHRNLMELQGNIRVHCRLRPLTEFDWVCEESLGSPSVPLEMVIHNVDDENVCVRTVKYNKTFEFEKVYGSKMSQEDVFQEVQPMLTSLLDGYNVCIMAYGQTGSGKTHTMLGSHENEMNNPSHEPHPSEGIIPRAIRELFSLISTKPTDMYGLVEVSIVEIYNNDVHDLLGRKPGIKHDLVRALDGSLSIPSLTFRPVTSVDGVMSLIQHCLHIRRETATLIHEHSSRSHLIMTVSVTIKLPHLLASTVKQQSEPASPGHSPTPTRDRIAPSPRVSSPASQIVKTKLQLVDLAGSECIAMSGVSGAALRESSCINKSLSALADVFGALAEHRSHIPYRNSRLTHFLQDSVGGDAKMLILLCISPAQQYLTESLHCLSFGQRVRQVQRGQTRRKVPPHSPHPGDTTRLKATFSHLG